LTAAASLSRITALAARVVLPAASCDEVLANLSFLG
jgi:hypothetical protein